VEPLIGVAQKHRRLSTIHPTTSNGCKWLSSA
jgi:hypothetical protein